MKRSISSGQTFFVKVVLPLLWILIFGVGVFTIFSKTTGVFIFALLAWLAGAAFLFWFGVRLKKVSVDETTLYISNYLRESMIPLQDITNVTEIVWLNIHPVTIHLKTASPFGNKILFMPEIRFFSFFRPHPIVGELKEAAQ